MTLTTHLIFYLSIFGLVPLLFPSETLHILEILKTRFRQHLIRKYGTKAFNEISDAFLKQAQREGYQKNLVEQALMDIKEEIIEERGRKYVEAFLERFQWYE
jgi:hypothetical protein